jgi:serine/threonine-protein kinase
VESERYARIKALFDEVCDLAEPERSARLAATADTELIRQVRALLAQAEVDTAGFSAPIASMLTGLGGENLEPGATLGAWTLLRRIGEGGMGTVYQAQRSDGHFEQTAAIKVLRGLPSASAMQYLARERQILAGLTHPNIARLLDGGATPGGQPYLVMEYLDGSAIDRYCRERGLGVAAILKLLITVCDAVSFAHQRLIVHCDLKPSNILVDAQGRPSLLDFGIARLLDVEGPDGAPSAASLRARAFTPGFASPEQESGGTLSTASDIYSLGRLAEDLIGADRLAADRELAAIVARATQGDPASRYVSADALAQDLSRYLRREPLAAMPPTLGYRTLSLVRRRWPAVLAAALFLVTVAIFTWQLSADRDRALSAERAAVTERDHATQAQLTSKKISEFLVSILDAANPDAGSGEIPTSKLVEQALGRIDTELAGQPAVQAELYAALAGVQEVLGNPALAQDSYAKAIALERGLDRPLVLAHLLGELAALRRRSFPVADAVAPARESLQLLKAAAPGSDALVQVTRTLGIILSESGDKAEGEALLLEALAGAEAIDPAGPLVVRVLTDLAGHQERAAQFVPAEQSLRRALALSQARADGAVDALGAKEELGRVLGKQRRFAEAEVLLREALEQRRALHGADDDSIPWQLSALATVLDNQGQPLKALPLYREALAIAAPKMGVDSVPYAVLLNNLALASMRVGDYAESERAYRQGLAIASKAWGERDEGLANYRYNLGNLLLRTRPAEAEPLLKACESVFASNYPADHPEVIATRVVMAVVSARLGHVSEARDWIRQIDDSKAELTPISRADREYVLALIARDEGQLDAALAGLERSEDLRVQALNAEDPRVWTARIERAEWLVERGSKEDLAASATLAAQISARLDGILVPNSPVRERLARLR